MRFVVVPLFFMPFPFVWHLKKLVESLDTPATRRDYETRTQLFIYLFLKGAEAILLLAAPLLWALELIINISKLL